MTEISTNPIKTFSGGVFSRWLATLLLVFAGALGAQAQVTANFTSNTTTGCAPALFRFTNTSTGGPFTSTRWEIINQSGVNVATYRNIDTPSALLQTPGTYTVKLTVINGTDSNTKTVPAYLTVDPRPIVSFTADSSISCLPHTVQFTSNVTNPGTNPQYLWTFGAPGAASSTLPNPSYTYTTPGKFTVILSVTNASGCQGFLQKDTFIRTVASPTASFSSVNASTCTTAAVRFIPGATGTTISSTKWYFGDGDSLVQTTPAAITHTYPAPGTYNVRLIVDNGTCQDTFTQQVTPTINGTVASFTGPATACVNTPVLFTPTSNPAPTSGGWNFGNGITDPSTGPLGTTYTAPGTYTVTYTATLGGCTDTETKTITIVPPPTANFTASPDVSCNVPTTVSFTNSSTGATSYRWDFDNGNSSTAATPPSQTYTANTYQVKLVATSAAGCKDSITKPVIVGAATMTVAASGNLCTNSPIRFAASVLPVAAPGVTTTYTWNFGSFPGSPKTTTTDTTSFVFPTAGTYPVIVTATRPGGCTAKDTVIVKISTRINSDFTFSPQTACIDSPINFSGINPAPAGATWTWAIQGIGTFAPSARRKDTTYRVSPTSNGVVSGTVLLILDNNGCRDTTSKSGSQGITVTGPRAQFTDSFSCANKLTRYFNSTGSQRATSYTWNFGDGTPNVTVPSTTNTVNHTYATYGRYTVTFAATDGTCTTRAKRTILISNPDSSFFFVGNPTAICNNGSVTLRLNDSVGVASVRWQFSSTDSTGLLPPVNYTRVYSSTGTFPITLTVFDSAGCAKSSTRNIVVRGVDVDFSATPLAPCAPDTVFFTDLSTRTPGSTIVSRRWAFGDGTFDLTNVNPSHIYSNVGSYSVSLRLVDDIGCRDSVVKFGYINPVNPVAAGSYLGIAVRCANEPIKFTNSSTNAVRYLWIFGDGNTSTLDTPTHAFAAAGTYNVRLVAYGAGGCTDTTSVAPNLNITILTNPAVFTINDSFANCPSLAVSPIVPSSTPGSYTFFWDFGNGVTSTQRNNNTVQYTKPGTYTIKLVVTTPSGCKDSTTKTVRVLGPSAVLDPYFAGGCVPLTVTFRAVASSALNIRYDFGDGNYYITNDTNGTVPITYRYNNPGVYQPSVTVGNSTNCIVTYTGPNTISVGTLVANFTTANGKDTACAGTPVQFIDTSASTAGPATSRQWTVTRGTTIIATDTAKYPLITFPTPGTYNVRLLVNTSNCNDDTVRTFIVKPSPTITSLTGGGTLCTGTSTQLQVTATSGTASPVGYQWTPATGLSCTTCSNPLASPSVSTTYTVVVDNNVGCTDTDTVAINVGSQPTVVTNNDTAICSGNSVQINSSGVPAYSWSVLPGGSPITTLSCTTCANPVATPTVTTSYVVIGSYGSGPCSDTDTVVITVNPTPVLTVSPNVPICSGRSTRLSVSSSTPALTTYSWTPTASLSNATSANPVANPTTTTTYTVVGTNTLVVRNNTLTCTDTKTVTVTVNTSPVINAGADQGLCPGQTYTFPSVGVADSYSWTPTTDLSNPTSDAPTVSRAATPGPVTYYVVGTNLNGCSDTDTVVITTYPGVTLVTSNDTTICSGASDTLSVSGAATYRWTPNLWISSTTSANPIVTPLATTTYYVVGTDANSCIDTDSVVVTVIPSPNLVVGNNFNLCSGTTAQLNASNTNPASVGPITYNWSPAIGLSNSNTANPTVSNLSASTIYTIVATDASNGCTDTAYQIITPVQSPNVVAAASIPSICYGQATNLSASGASSYQWSPNVGLTCTNCATPNAVPNTTTTYTVVGSANGCSDTDSVRIVVNPLPIVTATPDSSIICAGQSVQLNATGGAPFYTWTPSTGLSCTNCSNPIATPPTTTIYTVTARTSFGCTATAQSVVIVNPKANVIAAADDTVICEGDSTILRASGALNYTWYPSAGLSCTNCTDPVTSPTVSTTYRVIGSGVALCDDTAYIYVRVIPKPDLTVTPAAASICLGDSITLTASSSATGIYNWRPAAGLSCTNCPSPVASPTRTTIYTASFTALATGCTARQDVEVNVKALPTVDAGPDRVICAGVPTELKVLGSSTYVWSPATGLSCTTCNNPTATIYDSTTYVITGTDIYGCSNTDTLTLTIVPRDTLTVTPDTTICAGSSIRLQATGGTSYLWSPVISISNPRIANPTVFPSQTTTYSVAIANANCYVDTLSVKVTVAPIPVVNAGVDANVVPGESVQLTGNVPSEVVRLYWTPVDFLSCNDCLTPVATPRTTTTYILHGITAYGCEGTDSVTIFTRCTSSQVFVPNTFTPNGDGQNDRFYPRGNGLGNIKSFRIYSRWGELVYEAQNIQLNDETTGWDGIFKGQPLKPDTYVWILEGTCETGDPLTMNGDISIIR